MVPPPAPRMPRVDRNKVSPSLLRVFVRTGQHHPDSDFSVDRLPVADELQLYTWPDSSLREILLLARDALPALRAHTAHSARYSLRLVFFDNDALKYNSTDLALVSARDLSLSTTPSSSRVDRTLQEAKYVVGDLVDIAFFPSDHQPAPPPNSASAPPGAPPGSLAVAGPFGIRGAAAGRGGGAFGYPGRGGGAFGGAGRGPPVTAHPRARAGDTWAPAGGAVPRGPRTGAGPGPGPAAGTRGGVGGAADHGWGGARRGPPPHRGGDGPGAGAGAGASAGASAAGFEGRDRPPHVPSGPPPPRRRSSRSRSPGPRPSRRGSPPPRRRRDDDDDDVPMRD
ncbi:hypothetical protein JCM3770_004283 [Rhodotorula araucariae]